MKSLSNTIYQTYTDNFSELSPKSQLHFASRISQWTDNVKATALLRQVVTRTQPENDATIAAKLTALLTAGPANSSTTINAYHERARYFEIYKGLYGLHQALFQIRNWLYHYGIDARPALRSLPTFPDYRALIDTLVQDVPALCALSTYAVNTAYLTTRLLDEDDRTIFAADQLDAVLNTYESSAESDILLAYFATHCVIAETIFYARPLPAATRDDYRTLLINTASTLGSRIKQLSLDAQFELLVASKLCGVQPEYYDNVIGNGQAHFDDKLGFITDPLRSGKNTLETAEHRNVLFIMATQPCKLA